MRLIFKTIGWLKGCKDKRKDDWMYVKGWKDERMDEWMNEWMNDEWMNEWKDE